MKPVAIVLAGLALALGVLAAWLVWIARGARKPSKLPEMPDAKPPSPPAAPAPPSPERRFEAAVAQACARAFTAWWKGMRACPACREARYVIAPPQRQQSVEHAHPTRGRGGFVSWTQVIACTACGWSLSFPHTDAGPVEPVSLQLDAQPPVPRTWLATTLAGAPAGKVVSDEAGVRVEEAPELDGPTRAALSSLQALVEATRSASEPALSGDQIEVALERVLDRHTRMRGAGVKLERSPAS